MAKQPKLVAFPPTILLMKQYIWCSLYCFKIYLIPKINEFCTLTSYYKTSDMLVYENIYDTGGIVLMSPKVF